MVNEGGMCGGGLIRVWVLLLLSRKTYIRIERVLHDKMLLNLWFVNYCICLCVCPAALRKNCYFLFVTHLIDRPSRRRCSRT